MYANEVETKENSFLAILMLINRKRNWWKMRFFSPLADRHQRVKGFHAYVCCLGKRQSLASEMNVT